MSIAHDKNSIPKYDGTASVLYEEYCERAWDGFYGKSGKDNEQIASPLSLRGGLTGEAYEAVRALTHSELMTKQAVGVDAAAREVATEAGMKKFLGALNEGVNNEKPVRATEQFHKVFYKETVWRQIGETMQAYIQRRDRGFEALQKVSSSTSVSDDIKAWLLGRFSTLSDDQQSHIIGSAGNVMDLPKFKTALRVQHHSLHEKDQQRRSKSLPPRFKKKEAWLADTTPEDETYQTEEDQQQEEESYDDTASAVSGASDDAIIEAFLGEREREMSSTQRNLRHCRRSFRRNALLADARGRRAKDRANVATRRRVARSHHLRARRATPKVRRARRTPIC